MVRVRSGAAIDLLVDYSSKFLVDHEKSRGLFEIEILDKLEKSMFQDHQDQFAREFDGEFRAPSGKSMDVKLFEIKQL